MGSKNTVNNKDSVGRGLSRIGEGQRLCISVPEAAMMIGISRNNCYDLVKEHKLPSIRIGEKRIVIPKAALEEFLKKGVTT